MDLAQNGVVDAALVAQPDHGGAFVSQDGQARRGVLLVVPQRGLVVGALVAGVKDAQVLLVLAADPAGNVRVGAEAGGDLRDRGQRLLGGERLGQVTLGLGGGQTTPTTASALTSSAPTAPSPSATAASSTTSASAGPTPEPSADAPTWTFNVFTVCVVRGHPAYVP